VKRLLREPLVHFSLAGALLFAVHAWLNPAQPDARPQEVRIGEGEVKWLAETFTRQWGRRPTPDELGTLVSGLVREELLAREAREMRLDEDDTIVRRRLAQKVEFLLRDTERLVDPSDDELRRFYEAQAADFATLPRASFAQVLFSRERRKDAVADAAAALSRMNRAPGLIPQGDRTLLDAELVDVDAATVASTFGPGFARAVFALPAGSWHGPIESGYGVHLVRVEAIAAARPRELAEVRGQVLERWHAQRQRASGERHLERLKTKYGVVIDPGVRDAIGPLTLTQAVEAAR
jgi:hypothetical protein